MSKNGMQLFDQEAIAKKPTNKTVIQLFDHEVVEKKLRSKSEVFISVMTENGESMQRMHIDVFVKKVGNHLRKYRPLVFTKTVTCETFAQAMELTMTWNGTAFYIESPNREGVFPVLSSSLIEAFMKFERGDISDSWLFSDEVSVYNAVITGRYHRYPVKFFQTLKPAQIANLCKYFIQYLMGFDEDRAVEVTMKDITKYKLYSMYTLCELSIHEMVSKAYPDIKPWEMIKTKSGTFSNRQLRMEAIDFYLSYLNPNEIHVKDLVSNVPGAYGYYSKLGIKLPEIRKDITDWRIQNLLSEKCRGSQETPSDKQ